MKKILVTGAKFSGAVALVYGPSLPAGSGMALLSVDFAGASLDDKQKAYVLNCVPVRYGSGYEQDWGPMTGKVKIITEDYEADFERDFFRPFGHAVNKARCRAIWNKLSSMNQTLAAGAVNGYLRYLARNGWMNKMMPETFLKKKGWETDWDNV